MSRTLPRSRILAAALALAAGLPATAQAADFYAAPGGGGDCVNAPCSIAGAVLTARSAPGADVIHLAAGTYDEPLVATDAGDSELTISGAGDRLTVLAAAVPDSPVVDLGAGTGGVIALDNLMIDAPASGLFAPALRSRLARLNLTKVRILHTSGPLGKAVPAIDASLPASELVLDAVDIFADTQSYAGTAGAVTAAGPLTIRDSRITHISIGDTPTVLANGDVAIQRSTIAHRESNAGEALHYLNTAEPHSITLDSSLLTGGRTAARFDVGVQPTQIALRGVTLAPTAASNGYSVDIEAAPSATPAQATIVSALLLTRSVRVTGGASAVCTFSNLPLAGSSGDPACPTEPGNASGNTTLRADELQLDKDFAPQDGSPAIDSGDPSGTQAGESLADRLGRPRASASADVCEAGPGRRDKGAFERYRPRPQITISGPEQLLADTVASFSATTTAADPVFSWSFGDGAPGAGQPTTSHAFEAGASTVALEVIDRASGCASSSIKSLTVLAPPSPAVAGDRSAPRLTRTKFVRARIKRGRGARLRFTLSEAATVTITVRRRVGKKLVGTRRIVVKGRRGANRVILSRKKAGLRRARFAVTVVARDDTGNASKTVARKLIVR